MPTMCSEWWQMHWGSRRRTTRLRMSSSSNCLHDVSVAVLFAQTLSFRLVRYYCTRICVQTMVGCCLYWWLIRRCCATLHLLFVLKLLWKQTRNSSSGISAMPLVCPTMKSNIIWQNFSKMEVQPTVSCALKRLANYCHHPYVKRSCVVVVQVWSTSMSLKPHSLMQTKPLCVVYLMRWLPMANLRLATKSTLKISYTQPLFSMNGTLTTANKVRSVPFLVVSKVFCYQRHYNNLQCYFWSERTWYYWLSRWGAFQ